MSFNVSVSVRVNQGRVSRLLRLPSGPVGRMVRRKTERVATQARRLAPGSMTDRVSTEYGRGPDGLRGDIVVRHPAVLYVVHGTRPHVIRPVRARALRFTVGGRVVYATIVRHPGTRPNDFLTQALRAARG